QHSKALCRIPLYNIIVCQVLLVRTEILFLNFPILKWVGCECGMNVKERMNCGFAGISVKECVTKGCCFDDKYPGVPWFAKPSKIVLSPMDPKTRANCGPPGITAEQCENAGCCFSSEVPGVPWCFAPLPKKCNVPF
uniref:Trefoil factor 2 n=1 Tax=Terrapene triunguis TaxID=2587831 RepID=A0A674K6F5_9SAUR